MFKINSLFISDCVITCVTTDRTHKALSISGGWPDLELRISAMFSTVAQVHRSSSSALRRSTLDFFLGGHHSSVAVQLSRVWGGTRLQSCNHATVQISVQLSTSLHKCAGLNPHPSQPRAVCINLVDSPTSRLVHQPAQGAAPRSAASIMCA